MSPPVATDIPEATRVKSYDAAEDKERYPNVYLTLAVPRFPIYLFRNGVRGSWAADSILPAVSRPDSSLKGRRLLKIDPMASRFMRR
jgi:hypothetical protein